MIMCKPYPAIDKMKYKHGETNLTAVDDDNTTKEMSITFQAVLTGAPVALRFSSSSVILFAKV